MPLRRLVPVLVLLAVVLTAFPAGAVDSSVTDDDVQPFVGLAVFGSGGSVTETCSGVLLAPTVFVTAGHCADGADVALVWFESDVQFSESTAQIGLPVSRPAFGGLAGFSSSSEVGVVILDEPVDLPIYAVLPAIGAFDGLPAPSGGDRASFTVAGYGLQAVASFMQDGYFRYRGIGLQVELDTAFIDEHYLQLFTGQGRRAPGGACFGDSGGPALVSGTNIVAGVGSFMATPDCAGAGTYFRLDTDHAQEFVLSFLR